MATRGQHGKNDALSAPMGTDTGANGITIEVLRSFVGNDHLRDIWDRCTEEMQGTVYMAYDWCKTWWEYYGESKELRVLLFTKSGCLVGILPMYVDHIGLGPIHLKVARLVGANIPPKVFNPAVAREHAREIFSRAIQGLIVEHNCDLISLGPLSDQYAGLEGLKEAPMDCRHLVSEGSLVPAGVHTVIHLPLTYDAYVKALAKKERYYLRKDEARLFGEEWSGRLEIVSEPEKLEHEFEMFAEQHARQWAHEGKAGHFSAWPEGRDYNLALVKRLGQLGRVRFIRIVTNSCVVARQYVFAFGQSYFWELPSREVGREWESFSLGRIGAAMMVRAAIEEKKSRVEAGMGHYSYKGRLNANEYGALVFRITSRRLGARARSWLFRCLTTIVRILYHKLWYRRVMPLLPAALRRSQWRFWLKLDF